MFVQIIQIPCRVFFYFHRKEILISSRKTQNKKKCFEADPGTSKGATAPTAVHVPLHLNLLNFVVISNFLGFLPSGAHEYIDVIIRPKDQKKEVRFVVELEFQAEFVMAKGCEDYAKLVNQLPESYVGKFEHLNALVRVICDAGKRAMNEKKIHMGPWRKREFMQMKWSGSRRRWSFDQSRIAPVQSSDELHMPSVFRCPTVKVA